MLVIKTVEALEPAVDICPGLRHPPGGDGQVRGRSRGHRHGGRQPALLAADHDGQHCEKNETRTRDPGGLC